MADGRRARGGGGGGGREKYKGSTADYARGRPFDAAASNDSLSSVLANILRLLGRHVQRYVSQVSERVGLGQTGPRARQPLRIVAVAVLVLLTACRAAWWQLRRNLVRRRVLSVPHVLAGVWVFVLLWGERWIFHAKVAQCHWDHWERWPSDASPHHLVFVADPQLIDAHTYPGRPWAINALTILLTDNYMRRSYRELQEQLRPDTVFFLGDLFDGGREWRPAHGDFADPAWSRRPTGEQAYARMWQKSYSEDYWQREYARFSSLFLGDAFEAQGVSGGSGGSGSSGRGRRLIASLPGNHDLGFGDEVQQSVRDRFTCYFGDSNRVDVIGNHTFVSVDTVSLSAGSSDRASDPAMQAIYGPSNAFLDGVSWSKQKAVARELRRLYGGVEEVTFPHHIENLEGSKFDLDGLRLALGSPVPLDVRSRASVLSQQPVEDLPTVLLSHVPLFRAPGTPCGPLREHWPPQTPEDGSSTPVFPDHRNAISVSRGYQYQNVLNEVDSARLVQSIGNVVHAFSGDDHDYCEVVHERYADEKRTSKQMGLREITVKAFSMAMGVPTPGFLMVSLWNPVDEKGAPLSGQASKGGGKDKDKDKDKNRDATEQPTLQTHLCLLPNQLGTFARYIGMIVVSLVLLAARAVLVPVLGWQPFALDPQERAPVDLASLSSLASSSSAAAGRSASSTLLPMYSKAKVENDEYGRESRDTGPGGGAGGGGAGSGGAAGVAGTGAGSQSLYSPAEKDGAATPRSEGGGKNDASGSSGFVVSGHSSSAATYARGRAQLGVGTAAPDYSSHGSYGSSSNHSSNVTRPARSHRHKQPQQPSSSAAYGGPKIQIMRDEDDEDDEDEYDEGGEGGGRHGLDEDDYYSNSYSNSYSSYSGYGEGRWQPAARWRRRRRGIWGLGRTAVMGAASFVWSAVMKLRGGSGGMGGGGDEMMGGSSGSGSRSIWWWGRQRRRRAGFGAMLDRRRGAREGRSRGDSRSSPTAVREFWTTTWRVAWIVVVYWAWLNHKG